VPFDANYRPKPAFDAMLTALFTAPRLDSRSGAPPGGLALNQDNSPNTSDNPAWRGTVIQVVSTGGGPLAAGAADATIGGVPATVLYAGPAPGQHSATQVDLVVPSGIAAGPQPVVIHTAGAVNQSRLTLTVK
jgi:uncharacterized protein (TIGR03437 family)